MHTISVTRRYNLARSKITTPNMHTISVTRRVTHAVTPLHTRIRLIWQRIRLFLNPLSRVTCGRDVAKSIVSSLLPNNKSIWRHNFRSSWTHVKSCSLHARKFSHLNCTLNYVKQWVDIFKLLSVSGGRIGRQRQLK